MGKTTTAAAFRRAGVPVFDADAAVHRFQGRGGAAVRPIGAAFPGTVHDGAIDRTLLRHAVLGQKDLLRRLEAIMHPMVHAEIRRFLHQQRRAGSELVVLDIPLLLESGPVLLKNGRSYKIDHVVVVSAPAGVQARRLQRRRGMTEAETGAVLARQMPDREKRRRADVVIHTGLSRHHAQLQVRRLVARLR